MWYVIVAKDGPDSLPKRKAVREVHLQRLEALRDQGRLLTAGPMPAVDAEDPGEAGFSGSVIIAEFPSLEAAREWFLADPYMAAEVYAEYDVQPYRKVY